MPKVRKNLPALILLFFISSALVVFSFSYVSYVYAENECEDGDLEKCEEEIEKWRDRRETTSSRLADIRSQKNSLEEKIANLSGQLNVTQAELNEVQAEIDDMNAQLDAINQTLADKNKQLEEKIAFRNKVIRDYSKQGVLNDLELLLLAKPEAGLNGFQYSALSYMFEKSLNLESRRIIGVINQEINNYEADKAEAEALRNELVATQNHLLATMNQIEENKQLASSEKEVLAEEEEEFEEELQSIEERISELTEKQQAILKAKYGEGYSSLGNYEAPDWSVPDPPFDNAFAVFSYGAFTHYNGMSQYGAKGRAEDGQDYKDIIEHYYGHGVEEKGDFPDDIDVCGYGEMDFQDYLYGLAEMPSSWPEDALKAQAIAGRSYAYSSIKRGADCICTSQSCQVFSKSKSDNPPDRWKEAVDDTKDKIIDADVNSSGYGWYSSTTGGYTNQGGWDTDGSWPNNAYENKADSPWFYWAWYSKNYRFDSDTCGHSHPWLTEEEMADILNAWVVITHTDDDRVSPVTTSCWGGDPYSHDELRDRAGDYGTSYERVTSADASIGDNGRTNSVTFQTDEGSVTISGSDFKNAFNLRAPAYVAVRSRLFDIQKE